MPRLSKVEPRVTMASLSAISALMIRVGRGVVVTIACGLSPSRRPSSAWSKASGWRQAASSSHHSFMCCLPRSRSGSSAENSWLTAPFGHSSRPAERR